MTIDTNKSNGWLKECQLFKKKYIGSKIYEGMDGSLLNVMEPISCK